MRRKRVTIIGGGVIGLTCALTLAADCEVSLIADQMGSLSDSRKATAVWHVYLVPETDRVLGWAQQTLEKLSALALSEKESGLELIRGVELFRRSVVTFPTWSKIPRVFKMLGEKEVEDYNAAGMMDLSKEEADSLKKNPVKWGYHIEAPAASMPKYLTWLETRVRNAQVRLTVGHIAEFDELSGDSDVIINCSGFGSRELARDSDFVPYKGQYFVLKGDTRSPTAYVGDDDHPGGMAYAIPRQGEVLVGGSAEAGREDLELTLDWKGTIRRAGLYIPWLREQVPANQSRAPVVGIRPCRPKGVRVEVDHHSARVPVIHNYGHGGSGFSLSWGCAETVQHILASL